ncbi:MAG: hypothetical protein MUF23_14760 [Pirellula sp.]|nr:hypothetical protein [Pirellula sp.]
MTQSRLVSAAVTLVAGLLVGFIAAPAVAADLQWSLRLHGDRGEQIEVVVDTTGSPDNIVIDSAVFNAAFFDATGRRLGESGFSLTDGKLPALTAGHVYRRRFFHSFPEARKVSSDQLMFVERAAGGKADGNQLSASMSPNIQKRPDVALDAPPPTQLMIAKALVLNPAAIKVLDPAVKRCRLYTDIAVAQNEANLGNRCGFQGPMWSSKYGYHFDWCLGAPAADTRSGTAARQRMLDQCGP